MRFLRNHRSSKDAGPFPMAPQQQRQPTRGPLWKTAVDPASGRTYYFNVISRRSQWEKPEELVTSEELFERRQKKAEDIRFFREMEQNIRQRGHAAAVNISSTQETNKRIPSNQSPVNSDQLLPFSPTSSSSRSITGSDSVSGSSTSSPKAKDYVPSLLRVSSSTSEHSYASSTASIKSVHPSAPKHIRRNTTGTLHLQDSTPLHIDVDDTIESICIIYRNFIIQSLSFSETVAPSGGSPVCVNGIYLDIDSDLFEDRHSKYSGTANAELSLDGSLYPHNSSSSHPFMRLIPTDNKYLPLIPPLEELTSFYSYIYTKSQMEKDVLIASLVYCDRLIYETKGAIQPNEKNWRSIMLSCLCLASKVWDDCSMWNYDFSCICQKRGKSSFAPFTLQRINRLEVVLLKCLNFNVNVSASEYTSKYFHLQSISVECRPVPEPLDWIRVAKLGLLRDDRDFTDNQDGSRHRRANSDGGERVDGDFSIGKGLICLEQLPNSEFRTSRMTQLFLVFDSSDLLKAITISCKYYNMITPYMYSSQYNIHLI